MARASRSSWLAVALALGGCSLLEIGTPEAIDAGRSDAAEPDAAEPDAAEPDAAIDAGPIDTPANDCCTGPTYAGTLDVYEAKVLAAGGGFVGQGIVARLSFTSSEFPGAQMEEQPGSPAGCKVWRYTRAQAAIAMPGLDQGPLLIRSPAGGAPLVPSCSFAPGGYRCPELATESTGGAISAGVGPFTGAAVLTDADVAYAAANSDDRYVEISGATTPANDGRFAIVGRVGADAIAYANPAFVAEALPPTARHVNLGGVGPIPGVADPGFLPDDASVDLVHTVGGLGGVPAFTATLPSGTVGDSFSLAPSELARLTAIPRDGAGFTIACAAADCPTSAAAVTQLELITTDAPTAGLPPSAMPPPVTQQIVLRCAVVGASAVTVPPAYAAWLVMAGATRIQATFLRASPMQTGLAQVSALIGHAIVGYSD
ncbi:MAG: hypothetical protein JNK64_21470 [Myxococcales bacterium]|nr:hypothetical protein [Myxococcales bacterium]